MKTALLAALLASSLTAAGGDGGASGGGYLSKVEADALYAPIGAPGGGSELPVGSVYLSVLPTDPAVLLGYGTWAQIAQGRAIVGQDPGDSQFDVAEETSGAKTVASAGSNSAPIFTGAPFSSVINHTHTVSVTDPGHVHIVTSQTATTGSATSYEHGTLDTSSAEAEATETTASNTTGITAGTANPGGGVASITPAGTVAAPTFTGSATSVVQPSIVVYVWKRTL
jgi:hypothetical protein